MLRLALAFLLFGTVSAQAAEPCKLQRMAMVDAEVDGSDHLFIPAELAGRATKLMVDTGGAWSLIKSDLVDELKLERHVNQQLRLADASGTLMREYVSVPDLKLGDLKFRGKTDFVVMSGYHGDLDDFGGTIGLNIIARFDVEMDNGAKKIMLFHPDHCSHIGAYWADEWIELKLINENGLPETKVDIDGESIHALIDTGSTRTFMDLDLARRRFGLTPSSPGVTPGRDLTLPSGKVSKTYNYTFKSLTISGFVFSDVEVVLDDADGATLTLGMHELKHLHLYFAFKEKMLYATTADVRR